MFLTQSGMVFRFSVILVCLTISMGRTVHADEIKESASIQTLQGNAAAKNSLSDALTIWRNKARERREAYREKLVERRKEALKWNASDNREARSGLQKRRALTLADPSRPFGKLIARYASENGVPLELGAAVVEVESSFRPNATGQAGEIGLMQIKLSTARGMGFSGSRKELYEPATNLKWGMRYLGKAYQLAGGSTCGTILRYNAGHYAKRMNPISSRYCGRVKNILS